MVVRNNPIESILNGESLFILSCCRKIITDNPPNTTKDLFIKKDLDWNFIFKTAEAHGILGVLYFVMSRCVNKEDIQGNILEKCAQHCQRTSLKNLLYLKKFHNILKMFHDAHIRILPLKGISFLNSIYDFNIALREMNDIDILIDKKNLSRAEKILVDMGYSKMIKSFSDSRRCFHSNFICRTKKYPVVIELHWDIDFFDSPFNINITEIWERSHDVVIEGCSCCEFSIEDSIIFNAFHIFREFKGGADELLPLKNFCDVAKLIAQSRGRIDWDCIIDRSREYNVLRPVLFVLLLVRELFDIYEIPETIIGIIRNAEYQDDFACTALKEYIFSPRTNEKKLLPFWVVRLSSHATLRAKMKYLLSVPGIILQLFNARYYAKLNQSVVKVILTLVHYYTVKAISATVFYLTSPSKAVKVNKRMALINQKTQEVRDWLRG